jgi:hypothetical protein
MYIFNNLKKYNIMHLSLTPILNIDIDNAEKEITKKCYFCESKINLQATYYNNKIISACFLCHIVVNYSKEYIYYSVLCYTKLTQLEIIKKTWDFFVTKGYVPKPIEIDPNVKIVKIAKISTYIFANFKNKQMFSDYCLFFTNKVENMLTDETDDVFGATKKKTKIDILEYFDIPEHIFTDKEKESIEKEISDIKNNNYEIMIQREENLKERYSKHITIKHH